MPRIVNSNWVSWILLFRCPWNWVSELHPQYLCQPHPYVGEFGWRAPRCRIPLHTCHRPPPPPLLVAALGASLVDGLHQQSLIRAPPLRTHDHSWSLPPSPRSTCTTNPWRLPLHFRPPTLDAFLFTWALILSLLVASNPLYARPQCLPTHPTINYTYYQVEKTLSWWIGGSFFDNSQNILFQGYQSTRSHGLGSESKEYMTHQRLQIWDIRPKKS